MYMTFETGHITWYTKQYTFPVATMSDLNVECHPEQPDMGKAFKTKQGVIRIVEVGSVHC